jgi:H+/Cl- antiporter ClcA
MPLSFPLQARSRRERLVAQLHLRKTRRTTLLVVVAMLGGLAAAVFARVCDEAMGLHEKLAHASPWLALLLLPAGFAFFTWMTGKFAPEAAGSGIPQVIAAAETRWTGRWGGQRVTLRTGAWKVVMATGMLLCGASIGREGPTVQVVAGIMRTLTRGLRGGPGRRAIIIAGGAAGVAAAFNTPIAGVVFAVEELAKSFDRRAHTTAILVVVVSGFTAYAVQGDYAYFGDLNSAVMLRSAWLAAPIIGLVTGLAGGLFSRALGELIGPTQNPVSRWRRAHPIWFAAICGLIAAGAALVSGGMTYGAGYEEAKSLLAGSGEHSMLFSGSKFIASLAAAASGAPGGIFAPSLAIGAGIGASFSKIWSGFAGRDSVVMGMTGYLSGVVQAPLTSAVILMEMTRDPALVGPLMLTALTARWVSGWVMPQPIYHLLAQNWRLNPAPSADR